MAKTIQTQKCIVSFYFDLAEKEALDTIMEQGRFESKSLAVRVALAAVHPIFKQAFLKTQAETAARKLASKKSK